MKNESGKESRRGRAQVARRQKQREVEEKHGEGKKCDVTKTIKQKEETWRTEEAELRQSAALRRGSVRQLRDANALDQIIRLISHSKHHQSAKKSPISQTRSPTAPLTLSLQTLVWLTDTSHWLSPDWWMSGGLAAK